MVSFHSGFCCVVYLLIINSIGCFRDGLAAEPTKKLPEQECHVLEANTGMPNHGK